MLISIYAWLQLFDLLLPHKHRLFSFKVHFHGEPCSERWTLRRGLSRCRRACSPWSPRSPPAAGTAIRTRCCRAAQLSPTPPSRSIWNVRYILMSNIFGKEKRLFTLKSVFRKFGSMKFDTDSDPRIYPLDYGSSPKTVEIKVYLKFSACWWKDPDPYK